MHRIKANIKQTFVSEFRAHFFDRRLELLVAEKVIRCKQPCELHERGIHNFGKLHVANCTLSLPLNWHDNQGAPLCMEVSVVLQVDYVVLQLLYLVGGDTSRGKDGLRNVDTGIAPGVHVTDNPRESPNFLG